MRDEFPTTQDRTSARLALLTELVRPIHLTPTQRNIVRTLVSHIDRASYLSATQVAELAQVSQPSVTRFATALGFDGYPKLRAALREARDVAPNAAPIARNEWQRSIDFELDAMQRVRESVGDETLMRELAALLVTSRPLLVVGHRSAASIAQYFAYFASQFLADVRLLPSPGLGADLDGLVHAKAAGATAALVVVFPRYADEALTLMDQARELGIQVVCMTDSVASLAAGRADHLLIAPVDSSLTFDSYAVPMIVANVLLAAMAEADVRSTQERLELYDAVTERYGVFRE